MWVESVTLVGWSIPPGGGVQPMAGWTPNVWTRATEHWLTVDMPVSRRMPPIRLYALPMASIAKIEVDEWNAERSQYGWKLSTGFLHGPTTIGATSGMVVTKTDGHYLIFRLGGPVIAARTRLVRLMALVAERDT